MESITNFESLVRHFYNITPRKRVVVVCPDDAPTLGVISRCLRDRVVELLLVARADRAEAARETVAKHSSDDVTLIEVPTADEAAATAVRMVREKRADVILKGNINTDNLLRAVLNKECGLLPHGRVMSHVAVAEIPGYDRLLTFSDAAVIPSPTLDQLDAMLHYDVDICRKLGHENPKVALIHFTEKFNDKFVITTYYREILSRAALGQYGTAVIGGPMDVKSACDAHAAAIKGIISPVVGKSDLLIFPDLVAANTFYKTLALFANAQLAAMLTGTDAPIVVPSRADSDDSKFYSLALACVAAG